MISPAAARVTERALADESLDQRSEKKTRGYLRRSLFLEQEVPGAQFALSRASRASRSTATCSGSAQAQSNMDWASSTWENDSCCARGAASECAASGGLDQNGCREDVSDSVTLSGYASVTHIPRARSGRADVSTVLVSGSLAGEVPVEEITSVRPECLVRTGRWFRLADGSSCRAALRSAARTSERWRWQPA